MIAIDMMIPNKTKQNSGFTLIEMMVTILIAGIVILGLANVMADTYRSYRKMYERVHGNIANDAYVTRIRFDRICRKARAGSAFVDTSVPSLRVLYYATPNMTGYAGLPPDRYAEFYLNGTNLVLDTGTIAAGTRATTEIVARNVHADTLQFSAPVDDKSVQMVMTLGKIGDADSKYSTTVICGAIMHN